MKTVRKFHPFKFLPVVLFVNCFAGGTAERSSPLPSRMPAEAMRREKARA